MSTKSHRSGGKYGGNHTTCIPAAGIACDIANDCPHVTRIAPGFIKSGLRSVGGRRRVKITDQDGVLLLSVRDNISHQEVRVYASNIQDARTAIARGLRNANISISFGKGPNDTHEG